jgi:serine/threonine protein phosphatase PrpC
MALHLMLYKTVVYGVTDIGLVRQNNEDFWCHLPDLHFFALADGMGGHQAGEIASREVATSICHYVQENSLASETLQKAREMLVEAIRQANERIYRMGHGNAELKGMGTTLCCFFLHPKGLIYAHVGDSRIYRLRKGTLEQLTHDHSLMRELIELGQLNEQQVDEFQYKNIITKAIGTEPRVEPTVQEDTIQNGDIIMMCSDGLTDLLTDQELQHIITLYPENEIASILVKTAVVKGGYDNVTVVIVKIEDKRASTDLS